MVSLDYKMELKLENPPNNNVDLVSAASYFARDALSQCVDVSAMAFPTGHMRPTEEMLSSVSGTLRNLVLGIENVILEREADLQLSCPVSWNMLMQSGFLRDHALIEFALAMFANVRLNAHITERGNTRLFDQLPAQLLVNNNPLLSSAAQSLLTSETQIRRSPELAYQQLNSELLHQITWRIVAVLQVINGEKNAAHVARTKAFLANHDEATSLRSAARKIVYFLQKSNDGDLFQPAETGIAIFVAALAASTGLDHDHVLRLADNHSSAPLALMLRASGVSRESAMETICLFRGFDLTPLEISYVERHFDVLAISDAKDILNLWSVERVRQLSSIEMDNGGL